MVVTENYTMLYGVGILRVKMRGYDSNHSIDMADEFDDKTDYICIVYEFYHTM